MNLVNHFVFDIRYATPLMPPLIVRVPERYLWKTRSVEPHAGHDAVVLPRFHGYSVKSGLMDIITV